MRNRFHSLCPYFAMFPESFVETWVDRLTKPGDVVLDPFCGRGTTPFQSLLMGRDAVACDINPVAYCVTRAKTNAPPASTIRRRITQLERQFEVRTWEQARRRLPEFFQFAYHRRTLRQLLFLRSELRWQYTDVDCMIAALVLGSLHGESEKSQSYLSNQMPRTISTKPAYSVRFWQRGGYTAPERDVFHLLRDRVTFRYESEPPTGRGTVLLSDMRELPRLLRSSGLPIKCGIMSPPYFNITSFEEDQWLRLWFLGGHPRPTHDLVSKDDRLERPAAYWDFLSDLWRVLGELLASRSHVVIRIGGKAIEPKQMANKLLATSVFSQRKVRLVETEVSEIKGRQTDSFRPGSIGCLIEVDCCFAMA